MLRCRYCSCVLCAVAAVVAYLLLFAAPQTASAQPEQVSFINDVAPILKENCFACHDAKKKSGKYDMTTFEKLLRRRGQRRPDRAGQAGDRASSTR